MNYDEQHLKNIKQSGYPKALVGYLVDRFKLHRTDTVYDFGCGRGGYTVEWAKECKVVGFDCLPQKVDFEFHKVDLNGCWAMRRRPKTDVVFSKSVVEHLQSIDEYLENAWDALLYSGRLIVMTPDWKTSWKVFYDDYTHVRPWTVVSLKEAVDTTRWAGIEVEVLWQVPFAWKYPITFKAFRWIRFFMPEGDLKRRMSHAALLLTCKKRGWK